MLKIEHLTKAYAKSNVKAVDDLNLELKSGEIFGFLGPNGAGKTTTIKMLTGILGYDTGSISICGHDLKSESTKAKRNIATLYTINLREKSTLSLWRIYTE